MILVWLILIIAACMIFAAVPLLIGWLAGLVVSIFVRRS